MPYADARELLEKEKDLNAVKIMTPDHLHGVLSMAAMRKRQTCFNAQAIVQSFCLKERK
jgi:hypothetical protein